MRQRIVDYLVYWVVRVLICLVQAVPIETGQRIARGLAWLFCDVLRIRGGSSRRQSGPRLSRHVGRSRGPALPDGCGNICSSWCWKSPTRRGNP